MLPRLLVSDQAADLAVCQNVANKRTREVSEEELTVLRDEVSKYQIEGDLVCIVRRLAAFSPS